MADSESRVWVFFYGTFMSAAVLGEHGVHPERVHAARLTGYELSIRPRVNLARSDRSSAFGSLALVKHRELESLYAKLRLEFGLVYDPQPVLVEALDGGTRPALCYVTETMPPAAADPAYVRELAACVRSLGLPEWYATHVESFAKADL